jgi:GT2 family glycosyltransferase
MTAGVKASSGADPQNGQGLIYVVLPVHNRRAVTERFLRCLLAQTDQAFHLILIDDGSSDGTAEVVLAAIPTATVIRGDGSWWWAGSLQRGFDWLQSRRPGPNDLLLIANDDTEFGPEFLQEARRAMADAPRSLLLAQVYDTETGKVVDVGAHVDWRRLQFRGVTNVEEANCFSTRGLFLHARDLAEIGRLHPTLLPHYASDYEYTIRARRKGFRLISDPQVRLFFDETTTGTHTVERQSVMRFLRETFRTRTAVNPFYLTTFILLACPRRLVPLNVIRVWGKFAIQLKQCVF